MIEVFVLEHDRDGARQRFDQQTVRLGRRSSNDLVLKGSHVSARHGEICCSERGVVYKDLATTNGSYILRGTTLIPLGKGHASEALLRHGDDLFLGDPEMGTCLRIGLPDAAETATPQTLFDTGDVEVLTRIDMTDDAGIRRLSSAFDREALLALHEYTTRATRQREQPEILSTFASTVLKLFRKANHLAVYFVSADSDELQPLIARTRTGEAERERLSRTVRDVVRERREAVSFAITDPEFDAAESLKRSAVRTGMCAPLWVDRRITGLVQVDCRGDQKLPFDQRDLEVLAVFANELANNLENTRLQAELTKTVDKLRQAQSEMESLVFRDPLTGLSNRRLLLDRLEQSIRLALRKSGNVALLYLDLDHFKRVNDTFGHEAGDTMLKTVAERIRGCLREQDTVARIGGDEFAAVLFDVADGAAARTVALKILDAVRQPITLPEHSLTMTASIGLTLAPEDSAESSVLLRNADMAMYRAKSRGRDTFQFFTEDMNLESSRQLYLETELRSALKEGQFIEHFQPIVRLSDLRVTGLEALVRWNHPVRGLTLPEYFIDVAEKTGLIVPIGHWVLRNACLEAKALGARMSHRIRIAVNLSARQFMEPRLPKVIGQVLEESGLDPGLLELELTESMLMEDTREGLARLRKLKDLGVSLSVDDFGTGYSSLSYLKRFPVDTLKIDRSFVQGIPEDQSDAEIATAVIAMAHKLRIKVVAEGVETRAQLEFLRANDCDYLQGFLFSTPMPIGELRLKP